MRRAVVLFFVLLMPVAGCDGTRHAYPSLAARPVEKRGFDEPERPAATVAPDPALDAELARDGVELERIAAGFAAAAGKAERAVAAGASRPVGSEPWLAAQAALAALDDWRGQASALTAAIEARESARAGRLEPAYPGQAALGERAAAEADRETGVVQRLQAILPGG